MNLEQKLLSYGFYISKKNVLAITQEFNLNESSLMEILLALAAKKALAPVSNYYVGAVGLTESGSIILGCNLEIPKVPLNNSIHAEQFLSVLTLKNKERLKAIALTAEPCGHCRQFLIEMNNNSDLDIILPGTNEKRLKQLLPDSFGPKNLGIEISLYDGRNNNLVLEDTQEKDKLVIEALKEANISYAPYTHCHSGVAMSLSDGNIASGFYIENAAFNPSISPLLASLVHLRSLDLNYSEIKRAVLVEKKNAIIKQEENTRHLLNIISPKATLDVYEALC